RRERGGRGRDGGGRAAGVRGVDRRVDDGDRGARRRHAGEAGRDGVLRARGGGGRGDAPLSALGHARLGEAARLAGGARLDPAPRARAAGDGVAALPPEGRRRAVTVTSRAPACPPAARPWGRWGGRRWCDSASRPSPSVLRSPRAGGTGWSAAR